MRRGFDTPLLFGAVTRQPGPPRVPADRYPYNTALMMNAAGEVTGTFDKVFLMLFGEYIPFYDQIPWFTKLFPEASNFSRGNDPASFPLDLGPRRSGSSGRSICYEDILPGFVRRVARLDPERVHQHHQRRLVRPNGRALPAPGARGVSLGRAPARDDPGREHGGERPHRRRGAGPRADESVDPEDVPPAPPQTILVELAMLPGGGLYRHVGDLFGFGAVAALIYFLARRGSGKRSRSAAVR